MGISGLGISGEPEGLETFEFAEGGAVTAAGGFLAAPDVGEGGGLEGITVPQRGEIVYFDTDSGGAVFAVGSITFCGSLWDPNPANRGFNGPISRLLENVVRKFSGET